MNKQTSLFPHLELINPDISADSYSQIQNNSLAQYPTTAERLSSPDNIRTQEKTRGLGQSPKIYTSMDMLQSHIGLLEALQRMPGNIWDNIGQYLSDKKQAYQKGLQEGRR